MRLRRRISWIIGITVIGLLLALVAISLSVMLSSYRQLEKDEARADLERANNAITNNLENLKSTLADWAYWDDTYRYMQAPDQAFIDANLDPAALSNVQVNIVLLLDQNGKVILGKEYDTKSKTEVPLSPAIQEEITGYKNLLNIEEKFQSKAGIILLPQGPILVASRRILPSNYEGDGIGIFTMARWLDNDLIQELGYQTHLNLNLYPLNDPLLPSDVQHSTQHISPAAPMYTNPLTTTLLHPASSVLGAYRNINDINDIPILILRAELPRIIFAQGLVSIGYYSIALLLSGVVFFLVTLWSLNRFVISPLEQLDRGVSRISSQQDLSARLELPGNDELSRLADSINSMLAEINRSRQTLAESEHRYRTLFANAPLGIAISRDNALLYTNPSYARTLGYENPDDLVGHPLKDQIPSLVLMETIIATQQETTGENRSSTFETEAICSDGASIPVQVSISTITLEDGPASVLFLADITERISSNQALQQKANEVSALYQASLTLLSIQDPGIILQSICDLAVHLFKAREAWIILEPNLQENFPLTREYRIQENGSIQEFDQNVENFEKYPASVCLPLLKGEAILGSLNFYYPPPEVISEERIQVLQSFANQAATALQNSILFQESRRRLQELIQVYQTSQRLAIQLAEVEEIERKRLAQELHDQVGQNLTALSLNLNLIQAGIPAEFSHKLRPRFEDTTRLLEETVDRIRGVMSDLRPSVLDDYGLPASLRWLGEQFTNRTGITVCVHADAVKERFSGAIETSLFRIAQEALVNIAKHANASSVSIILEEIDPIHLRLTISDNGLGFIQEQLPTETSHSGWGINIMSERAEALGGGLQIISSPGAGTTLTILVAR
jgi:PAS domain S-box-containing protein